MRYLGEGVRDEVHRRAGMLLRIALRPLPQPIPVTLLRQQPFGEVHPFGELPELVLHLLQLFRQLRQLSGVATGAAHRRFCGPLAQCRGDRQ